jgi:hypothetical protein
MSWQNVGNDEVEVDFHSLFGWLMAGAGLF